MNILITGSTGNVGRSVIEQFERLDCPPQHTLFAAVRDINTNPFSTSARPIALRAFDFNDLNIARAALEGIDVVFLLRPPAIADVPKVFKPLIDLFKSAGIKHVVFLSVQGAENLPIIPHHKIEKLLRDSGLPRTFIRPSYFMQNLTTTLHSDVQRGQIYLPAGNAKFNWIDVDDIGLAVATVLKEPQKHRDQAYVITGSEQLGFKAVADMVAQVTGKPMRFISPSLLGFIWKKKREGTSMAMIFVLIMLHFLPRFSTPLALSHDFEELTGRQPGTLEDFIRREMTELK
jgi:uncharacterized protein YbjT (DUF2867 family)